MQLRKRLIKLLGGLVLEDYRPIVQARILQVIADEQKIGHVGVLSFTGGTPILPGRASSTDTLERRND